MTLIEAWEKATEDFLRYTLAAPEDRWAGGGGHFGGTHELELAGTRAGHRGRHRGLGRAPQAGCEVDDGAPFPWER